MELTVSGDMARNRTILAHVSAQGPVLSLVYTTTAELPLLLSFINKLGISSTPQSEPHVSRIFYVHYYKHTKTSDTISTKRTKEHRTTGEEMEGPTST